MNKSETSASDSTEALTSGSTTVRILLDGEQHDVPVDHDTAILDAALDAGLDPPYSCMAAACTTCMAKLQSGKVHMEDDDVLTDEEIGQGYILTCQARPRSHGIVVEYEG